MRQAHALACVAELTRQTRDREFALCAPNKVREAKRCSARLLGGGERSRVSTKDFAHKCKR